MYNFTKYVSDAYSALKSNKYDEALRLLDLAEPIYADGVTPGGVTLEDLYVLRGTIYMFQEDLESAKSEFEKTLRLNPYSSEACQGLGKVFWMYGVNDLAKTMLEWAVVNDAGNNSAKSNLAEVNKALGLAEDHNTLLLPPDEVAEYSTDSKLEKAYQLFMQKEYDEALKNLESIRQDYEERLASVENFKGFNFLALSEVGKAQESFERALRFNPESSQGNAGLGEVYFLLGKDVESLACFEMAIKYNPGNKFAKAGLEKVKVSMSADVEQQKSSHQVLEETIQEAYNDFSNKQYSEALAKIEKSEGLVRNIGLNNLEMVTSFKNFKGFNYLGLSDIESARNSFEDALHSDPSSSQACAGLAEIYYLTNMDKEAKTMYELAVRNNGANQFAVAGLAKVNRSLGFPETHTSLMN